MWTTTTTTTTNNNNNDSSNNDYDSNNNMYIYIYIYIYVHICPACREVAGAGLRLCRWILVLGFLLLVVVVVILSLLLSLCGRVGHSEEHKRVRSKRVPSKFPICLNMFAPSILWQQRFWGPHCVAMCLASSWRYAACGPKRGAKRGQWYNS